MTFHHLKKAWSKFSIRILVSRSSMTGVHSSFFRKSNHVVISVVICGQRSEEALVMIKSAIIFQLRSQLTFVIMAEFSIQAHLRIRVSMMLKNYRNLMQNSLQILLASSYNVYNLK